MANLNFDQASKIANETRANARETLTNPIAVAVLDSGGHLIVLEREDGAAFMRPPIAIGKAWGALGMGISSRTIRDRLKDRLAFQNAISTASKGRLIPVPGGVLICNQDGEVLGAGGISGDTSERDEYCAMKAIQFAGLLPSPEEEDPNWKA